MFMVEIQDSPILPTLSVLAANYDTNNRLITDIQVSVAGASGSGLSTLSRNAFMLLIRAGIKGHCQGDQIKVYIDNDSNDQALIVADSMLARPSQEESLPTTWAMFRVLLAAIVRINNICCSYKRRLFRMVSNDSFSTISDRGKSVDSDNRCTKLNGLLCLIAKLP